jgi:two-component system heavy metal sensor histidine kinase CusS
MRPLSLTTRLTLLFAIAAAIVFPIFGWVISGEMEDHFEEGDTAELRIIADAVYDALAGMRSPSDLAPVERRFDDILIGHHSASLYIGRDDGHLVFASSAHPDLSEVSRNVAEPIEGDAIRLFSEGGSTYRVLVRRMGGDQPALPDVHTIVVATPIDYHLTFLASFQRTLWLMVASGIVLVSVMGWIAVRQGHAPLREIVNRMRHVTASERAQAIPPESVPRELGDLARSFNEMLRRVDESFERLKNFNADIAHELRTPITNLMTQTQVSLSRSRTVDEYREILYSDMEEYERMALMVGDMLFLAQQDDGASKRDSAEVDLAAEVRSLFDYYEGWAEDRGVTLVLEGRAQVVGDRLLLQRALGNLLSNAIRHTPEGGTVSVTLGAADDVVTIGVENPGTPIPSQDLPKIFDRFFRVDPSRQRRGEGAGLGLAIVKSIVEVHDGAIDVASDEQSTRFFITLPAAAKTGVLDHGTESFGFREDAGV